MTFEEVLPSLKEGKKIIRKAWKLVDYDFYKRIKEKPTVFYKEDLLADDWELYQEPIDWDYIIKNKCLCKFWNVNPMGFRYDFLNVIDDSADEYKYHSQNDNNWWLRCKPVKKSEINFYEENKENESISSL